MSEIIIKSTIYLSQSKVYISNGSYLFWLLPHTMLGRVLDGEETLSALESCSWV